MRTEAKTALQAGSFFETWLVSPRGVVGRSLGRDTYRAGRRLGQGARVCATGRTATWGAAAHQELDVLPATLVDVEIAHGEALLVGLRTNRFDGLQELAAAIRLTVVLEDGRRVEARLSHPLIHSEEVQPGRFLLECGGLLATAG